MDAVQTLGMWLFWRSGGNGILVGSAGEVDQRMASGDPDGIEFRSIEMHRNAIETGRFPCGFTSFSLTFGSLHMVTHEFRSGNPGNDRAKISIHRSLARYGSFLSRHSRTLSRIHHIEMSTSERPVVKCRWIQLDPLGFLAPSLQ